MTDKTNPLGQHARHDQDQFEGGEPAGDGRVSQARLAGILELAEDAIISVDDAQRIVLFNNGAQRIFGYAPEEALGQPLELLIPPRFRDPHLRHIAGFTASNERARRMGERQEVFGLRKSGEEFPAEASISKFESDEQRFFTVILRDTTARVEAEQALRHAKDEAEQANRAKSEFLSRMSHELRTPLNAVLGFAQLLEMDPLTPDQHQRVNRILRAGRHLLDLINEILDISRIESGRLPLSPEPVRVCDAVREAIDLIRPLAAERGVQVLVDSSVTTDDYFVTADRQRLKQVLLNLLANAVKYNHAGGLVMVACNDAPDQRVCVAVQDTGPGIPEEKLERLFSPFDRLGAEATEVEGTGLGLALSKGLIEAMGGTISVASAVGEGSRFMVELARAENPAAGREIAASGDAPAVRAGTSRATRTVLYIEDNLPNLELIEQILARWSWVRLISAMQGRLGVDLATKHQPDLILLDLHLPDIGGIDVLRLIQEDPRTRDTPIVIISADATHGQVDRLLAAGARAYLTKPLDVAQFLKLTSEMLDGGD